MPTTGRQELIEEIHRLLAEEAAANQVSYNKEQPYQAYERIGFPGKRWSVEKRFAEYGLERFCSPEHTVLDIGSHCGFFTVEFALRCRLAHGIEPTPILNRVGTLVAEHLGVADRVAFFDCPFERFESDVRYDVVLSLAAFFTQDKRQRTSADDYFSKIRRLMTPDARLFYESTSYERDPGMIHYRASREAMDEIPRQFDLVRAWETPSGSPGWFRQFAIARQRTA